MNPSSLLLSLFAMFALVVSLPIDNARTHEKRYTGRGTWFDVGLGACGKYSKNSQPIIAMNHVQYKRSLCGKWITITNTKNQKTARGYIEDMCPGCAKGSLDLSPTTFKQMAPLGQGVIAISWGTPTSKRSVNVTEPAVDVVTPDEEGEEATDDGYDFDPAMELTADELDELMDVPDE